ncbi:MAG: CbiX/SirB N-terminal domain-containing protein [Thermostichus sp. DG_1_6_bins_120]
MSSSPLVFLVCHGSRDPEYQQAVVELLVRVRQQLSPLRVELVQLEGQPLSLAEQIHQRLHARLSRAGNGAVDKVVLLSLFMGQGSHVEEDLPAALAQVQAWWPQLPLVLTPPIGQHPAFLDLLTLRIHTHLRAAAERADAWIVLGHGSRLPGFAAQLQAGIQRLEQRLPGIPFHLAFAAQSPNLEAAVIHCLRLSQHRLQVLPFFLFPGGLLRSLQLQAQQLQQQWPLLQIEVEPPLCQDPQLLEVIADTLQKLSPALE